MKTVGQFSYFLPSNINQLNTSDAVYLEALILKFKEHHASENFNIIKFKDKANVSFLNYKQLGVTEFPELIRSFKYNSKLEKFKKSDFSKRASPLILHRQEVILGDAHDKFHKMERLTTLLAGIGAFDESSVIGSKKIWVERLSELNVKVKDFDLISIEPPDPTIPRHKTAISRYSFSKPIKKLLEHNLITNITSVFDYGCGRGDDIRLLTLGGYKAKGWDPYFTPDNKKISSDVVNLGFVLNVIESEEERVRVLKDAFGLTKKVLAISTIEPRRESTHFSHKDGTLTKRNTFQKFFNQSELSILIESALDKKPIPIAPSLFFVFKKDEEEQLFYKNRIKARALKQPKFIVIETSEDQSMSDEFVKIIMEKKALKNYEQLSQQLQEWIKTRFTSIRKAISWHIQKIGKDIYEKHQQSIDENLLLQASFLIFRHMKSKNLIEQFEIEEIYARFTNPKNFKSKATEILSQIANKERLLELCSEAAKQGKMWTGNNNDFYLSTSDISEMPILLQLFIEISDFFLGDISDSDIVRISISRNSLSHYKYKLDDKKIYPEVAFKRTVKLPFGNETTWINDDPKRQKFLLVNKSVFSEITKHIKDKEAFVPFGDITKPHLDSYNTKDILALNGKASNQSNFLIYCLKNKYLSHQEITKSMNTNKVLLPNPHAKCGKYLRFKDFFLAGETIQKTSILNIPSNIETYRAFHALCINVLDRVIEEFGSIELTYGFCSKELEKNILKNKNPRISSKLDQHASCEKTSGGIYICSRKGAAADFKVDGISMLIISKWIVRNCKFDRLYFYGSTKPIHISYGPEEAAYIAHMQEKEGRKIPISLSHKKFLEL
ncbi:DNA phosphorothioation-associated putative methyltransferase [Paracoccaceae bacterium]|nr:DNA phosphorothioation-associated putative methyltransferase [Paracoccaceae bacterium]